MSLCMAVMAFAIAPAWVVICRRCLSCRTSAAAGAGRPFTRDPMFCIYDKKFVWVLFLPLFEHLILGCASLYVIAYRTGLKKTLDCIEQTGMAQKKKKNILLCNCFRKQRKNKKIHKILSKSNARRVLLIHQLCSEIPRLSWCRCPEAIRTCVVRGVVPSSDLFEPEMPLPSWPS